MSHLCPYLARLPLKIFQKPQSPKYFTLCPFPLRYPSCLLPPRLFFQQSLNMTRAACPRVFAPLAPWATMSFECGGSSCVVPNPAAAPGELFSFLTVRLAGWETLGVWLGWSSAVECLPSMHELSLIPSTAKKKGRKEPWGDRRRQPVLTSSPGNLGTQQSWKTLLRSFSSLPSVRDSTLS